jgi:hypothetical protein
MPLLDGTVEKILATLGSAGIIAAIKGLWTRRRTRDRGTSEMGSISGVAQTDQIATATPIDGSPRVLDMKVAYTAFMRAPFLQRDDVKKHYIGLIGGTRGKLVSIKPIGEFDEPKGHTTNERVRIYVSGEVPVFTVVRPADFPGLGLLHAGAAFGVRGKVIDIGEWGIELADVELEFSV